MTGASGNVGSAVVRRLRRAGHDVVGVVRRPGGQPIDWVVADLSRDCHQVLVDAFRGADAVVHLAWGFQPTHRPDYLESLGVGGTRRMLDAVSEAGVRHVVHQSSIGAYAPRRDRAPVAEDWPTTGISSSPYSRHKVAAERLLDAFEARSETIVTRMRPGIIGQSSAGSAQLRYFLPTVVPAAVLRRVPVLPLDRDLTLQVVHADDVAEAIARALESEAPGPFNLAADPVLSRDDVATALDAVPLHVPMPVLRAVADLSWRARLQGVDPGWVDLAATVPILDTSRARSVLGWAPAHTAPSVLAEMIEGLAAADHGPSPVLRPRTVLDGVRRAWRRGPVAQRRRP
ncbi:nucleoside-diphosphate-sugar epimerase [Mumia flava]|uniref:Nucleoside-diphosphate-sugar epimerase n=1 Tax=Mumia flava TaxID=1348852 RepID=A0A2M9BDX8_9ACTN|nr:NAD-dependent epimerase/dehydratase family protein [Mumia flava]PJJ56132.1 nucleoside-diphosphate-sugar epimerase [Mumia flava]